MGTFVVGVIVLVIFGLACFSLYKDKKNGKHCSGCSGCSGSCPSCNRENGRRFSSGYSSGAQAED